MRLYRGRYVGASITTHDHRTIFYIRRYHVGNAAARRSAFLVILRYDRVAGRAAFIAGHDVATRPRRAGVRAAAVDGVAALAIGEMDQRGLGRRCTAAEAHDARDRCDHAGGL